MNFSFTRKSNISSIFATSNVYWTCVVEAYDFFHKSCVFFTSKGQVNDPIFGRSVTATSRFIS